MNEKAEWWQIDDPYLPPTLRHDFSGDPWGPCSQCSHPIYHTIHRTEDLPDAPPAGPS